VYKQGGFHTLLSYLKLVRGFNLLIIILAQFLLKHCVIRKFLTLNGVNLRMDDLLFVLLVVATVLIAAAGYMINDCLDVEADQVNKPGRVIIGKMISLKQGMRLYYVLNILGVLAGLYVAYAVHYFILGLIFPLVAITLWYYSRRYKKRLLIGNLVIALLSALVILIVWLFEFFALRNLDPDGFISGMKVFSRINTLVMGYTCFAFLVSLLREIVKDIEDLEGDAEQGCRTLPVVMGARRTRYVAAILTLLVAMLLLLAQVLLYRQDFTYVFWYITLALQPVTLYLTFYIYNARKKEHFGEASAMARLLMVAGILSMQTFCLSF
jgi:4-hydroxybenzoate polyprenyltransferase